MEHISDEHIASGTAHVPDDSPDDGASDRRRQILDAAFEEFAAEGYRGATIKRIAQRARLQSQTLIYWYFPTKEALFQAVLDRLPIVQLALDPEPLFARAPAEALSLIARSFLAAADYPGAQRILRLIAPEVVRRAEIADLVGSMVIGRVLGVIQNYLVHQVTLGRLRPHDTRSSARAFIGMLLPQLAGRLFLPRLQADGPTDDEHIATIVAIFLRGLRPDDEENQQARATEL
ncbi:MAG: TetR/AcrR family transcriptional regulator [Ktedonobacterales bacterium]